ncbi:multidrug MFS transporter [Domibacillus enclensis]|uniref:Multidrug MFS transporter n=1 Tax=Domibacillus enclensis TaxID=1017273 RepID=A0A1N6RP48_9BACI|nr:sugar transferase [Domibacillus enclensis]OXS79109.1 multidrug MFS transporter [Domibacillus enclensis]SIQ30466.1 Sugar transferase involved in LPS biosynthesis (colanic, teichoic acid) [Domibacillus enclensis]
MDNSETSTSKVEAGAIAYSQENKSYIMMKRAMDVAGAGLGILFLSFVFLMIAFLIKLEDPKGPVFFKQKRVGKDGKEFYMYKFRSMVFNAEELLASLLAQNEVSGAMFKMKNDPRVTKIGRFIRRTSLDELPQLWNVVKGEMSLVGPRPPLPREVVEYTDYDKQRLTVIPGCTGPWQVSGRNSVGFHEMVELDIEYIRKRCIQLDIIIILKTIAVLFGSKNAF